MPARTGTTLLEILIALVVLVIALVPLLRSGGAVHRQSYHAELRTQALIRARTLLGFTAAIDYDLLDQLAGQGGTGPGTPVRVPLEEIVRLGAVPPGPALRQLFETPLPSAGAYRQRLDLFSHLVTFTRLTGAMGQVDVRVFWKLPDDRLTQPRAVHLARVLGRPEASLSVPLPLR